MNSARKTKQKAKRKAQLSRLTLAAPRPRNPLVAPALQRKAGAHRKSVKSERQRQQRALRGELKTR